MNQNGRDDLAIYLGLQDFEVTFRSDFEVTSKGRFEVTLVEVETSRRRGRIKVVSVARRSGTHRCPSCGREHATGLFEEAEANNLQAIYISKRLKREAGLAHCYRNLALIAEKRGELAKALNYIEEAARSFITQKAQQEVAQDRARIRENATRSGIGLP